MKDKLKTIPNTNKNIYHIYDKTNNTIYIYGPNNDTIYIYPKYEIIISETEYYTILLQNPNIEIYSYTHSED